MIRASLSWDDFKALIAQKKIPHQAFENTNCVTAFVFEGLVYWYTEIFKSNDTRYIEADYNDWLSNYAPTKNKPYRIVDDEGRDVIVPYPRKGDEVIYSTHNLADKCTWFNDSTRVTTGSLTADGTRTLYSSGNPFWIDMVSGRVQDDDGLVQEQQELNPSTPHGYQVQVFVGGVEKTMREPFETSGGDYEVYWDEGQVHFFSALPENSVVTASYSYATTSSFVLRPMPNKVLIIESAEANFSQDVEMTDGIEYTVYGYASVFAPQLGLPAGTKIPLLNTRYKRLTQILEEAIGSYPKVDIFACSESARSLSYSEFRRTHRGIKSLTQSVPFRYGTVRELTSEAGMELVVRTTHDRPIVGGLASLTLYCTSKDV